jgi:hypothetical protein
MNIKEREGLMFSQNCLLTVSIIKEVMFSMPTRFLSVGRVVYCLPLLNYEYLPGCNYDDII